MSDPAKAATPRNDGAQARTGLPDDALAEDVLRCIVGGANPNEAKPIDADSAVALTAGTEASVGVVFHPDAISNLPGPATSQSGGKVNADALFVPASILSQLAVTGGGSLTPKISQSEGKVNPETGPSKVSDPKAEQEAMEKDLRNVTINKTVPVNLDKTYSKTTVSQEYDLKNQEVKPLETSSKSSVKDATAQAEKDAAAKRQDGLERDVRQGVKVLEERVKAAGQSVEVAKQEAAKGPNLPADQAKLDKTVADRTAELNKAKADAENAKRNADQILTDHQQAGAKGQAEKKVADAQKSIAEMKEKLLTNTGKALNQIMVEYEKNKAKADGNYEKDVKTKVLSGGVESNTYSPEKGVTVTVVKIAQTTLTSGGEHWDTRDGSGHSVQWTPRAEWGEEVKTVRAHPDGTQTVTVDKFTVYAEFKNKAGYSMVGKTGDAEASTSIAVHGEVSHSATEQGWFAPTTSTDTLYVHGEAGAGGKLHLSFDGVKGEVKVGGELNLGVDYRKTAHLKDSDLSGEAGVFARYAADWKTSFQAGYDPNSGTLKIKGEVGGELTAGKGIKLGYDWTTKQGNGISNKVQIVSSSLAGKISPDVEVGNGKIALKIQYAYGNSGGGIQGEYVFRGDYGQGLKNIEKVNQALDELGKDNYTIKVADATVGQYLRVGMFLKGFFA